MTIYIDFETRSEVDLTKVGTVKYAAHESTQILCIGYAVDSGPANILSRSYCLDQPNGKIVKDLYKGVCIGETFSAHNAFFEQCIWHYIVHKRWGWPDIPIPQWHCTMAKAAAHGLPKGLDAASMTLGLRETKDAEGKAVMLRLSKPKAPSKSNPSIWDDSPEKFKKLYEYCKQDVIVERAIDERLEDLPPREQKVWALDQKINRNGVAVDMPLVNAVVDSIAEYKKSMAVEFSALTEHQVPLPTQRAKFLTWLEGYGVETDELTGDSITEILKEELDEDVERALKIKLEYGKTSTAKYNALTQQEMDGRIYDLFTFSSAHTGRWGGKGVQLQNLPRGNFKGDDDIQYAIDHTLRKDISPLYNKYDSLMGVFSSLVRSCLVAPEGHKLICADFNAIEARVLAWLAGEEALLNLFREGKDPYRHMASRIFSKSVDSITSEERFIGKSAVPWMWVPNGGS